MTLDNNKIILIVVLMLTAASAAAQSPMDNLCERKQFGVIRFYRNDTIRVTCDTAYVINASTYKLYEQIYNNHRALNTDVRRLAALFDYTKTLYENRIQEQNEEYQALKKQFDDLVGNSQNMIRQTSTQLNDVTTSLTRIDRHVEDAQVKMEEAKKLIKEEMRNSFKQKLKWGVGGLLIGVGCTLAIVAVAK
ncbi:MAG: hypothetical protein ACOYXT_09145 [Bacteroidota bacterium]